MVEMLESYVISNRVSFPAQTRYDYSLVLVQSCFVHASHVLFMRSHVLFMPRMPRWRAYCIHSRHSIKRRSEPKDVGNGCTHYV